MQQQQYTTGIVCTRRTLFRHSTYETCPLCVLYSTCIASPLSCVVSSSNVRLLCVLLVLDPHCLYIYLRLANAARCLRRDCAASSVSSSEVARHAAIFPATEHTLSHSWSVVCCAASSRLSAELMGHVTLQYVLPQSLE